MQNSQERSFEFDSSLPPHISSNNDSNLQGQCQNLQTGQMHSRNDQLHNIQPKRSTKEKDKHESLLDVNQSQCNQFLGASIHLSMQETMRDSMRVNNLHQMSVASTGSCQNGLVLKSQALQSSKADALNTIVDMDQIRNQFKNLEMIRSSNFQSNNRLNTKKLDENQLIDMRSLHSQLNLFNENFENYESSINNDYGAKNNVQLATKNHQGSFQNSSLETSGCVNQILKNEHQQSFGPELIIENTRNNDKPKDLNLEQKLSKLETQRMSIVSSNPGLPSMYMAQGTHSQASIISAKPQTDLNQNPQNHQDQNDLKNHRNSCETDMSQQNEVTKSNNLNVDNQVSYKKMNEAKDSSLHKNQMSIGQQTFGEGDQAQSSYCHSKAISINDSEKKDQSSISKKNLGELIQYSIKLVSEMGINNSREKQPQNNMELQ